MKTLRFEKTGPASGRVFADEEMIAEIRDLHLCNVRLHTGGRMLIGEEAPLPLYWRQYAHHEDPDRNAGSNGMIELIQPVTEPASDYAHPDGLLTIRCEGTNAPKSIRSVYTSRRWPARQLSGLPYSGGP